MVVAGELGTEAGKVEDVDGDGRGDLLGMEVVPVRGGHVEGHAPPVVGVVARSVSRSGEVLVEHLKLSTTRR